MLAQEYEVQIAKLIEGSVVNEKFNELSTSFKKLKEEADNDKIMMVQLKKMNESLMQENTNLTMESSQLLEEIEFLKDSQANNR
jgi:regulator of replication initiation timing